MEYLDILGQNAVQAKYELQKLTSEQKNKALYAVSSALSASKECILKANREDYEAAKQSGMSQALLDRLRLTPERIDGMSEGLRQIVELEDPVGEIMESFDRPNGLHIDKVRVPMGVIGMIYEARPNVTADAFALCFKTGNAVILKGGKDAFFSNREITEIIRKTLTHENIPADAVQLIAHNDR